MLITSPPIPIQAVLVATVLIAAGFDWRFRRVPNWLAAAGFLLGVGLNSYLRGPRGGGAALLGAGLALAIYAPLYLLRGMGGGDVKLMAAVGALAGPGNWLLIFVITALAGGIAALLVVVFGGRVQQTAGNLGKIFTRLATGASPHAADPSLDVRSGKGAGLPHAVMIALGVLLFLAAVRLGRA